VGVIYENQEYGDAAETVKCYIVLHGVPFYILRIAGARMVGGRRHSESAGGANRVCAGPPA
jgi:hypothetical protein